MEIDNIEYYTLDDLGRILNSYKSKIKSNNGIDIKFPQYILKFD